MHLPPDDDAGLDLWVLIHSDLERTARVRVFRDFVYEQIRERLDVLEGRRPDAADDAELCALL